MNYHSYFQVVLHIGCFYNVHLLPHNNENKNGTKWVECGCFYNVHLFPHNNENKDGKWVELTSSALKSRCTLFGQPKRAFTIITENASWLDAFSIQHCQETPSSLRLKQTKHVSSAMILPIGRWLASKSGTWEKKEYQNVIVTYENRVLPSCSLCDNLVCPVQSQGPGVLF